MRYYGWLGYDFGRHHGGHVGNRASCNFWILHIDPFFCLVGNIKSYLFEVLIGRIVFLFA